MKLWEALKIHDETGCKIRPWRCNWYDEPKGWFADKTFTGEQLACEQWEVEPAKVEVTREQLAKAWTAVNGQYSVPNTFSPMFRKFLTELGLGES